MHQHGYLAARDPRSRFPRKNFLYADSEYWGFCSVVFQPNLAATGNLHSFGSFTIQCSQLVAG